MSYISCRMVSNTLFLICIHVVSLPYSNIIDYYPPVFLLMVISLTLANVASQKFPTFRLSNILPPPTKNSQSGSLVVRAMNGKKGSYGPGGKPG